MLIFMHCLNISLDHRPHIPRDKDVFIVLFLVPKDQFQTHLRTLAAIAKFLNDPAVRSELAAAPDAKAILGVFDRKRS